jgi:hypothetical protein
MRPIRKWATTVVAALSAILTFAGAASAQTVYKNIPSPLPGNLYSVAFQATSTAEFGGLVELAPGARTNPVVTVTMSSWGCQTGSGTTCATTPGAVFSLPITLNLYAVGSGNSVGELLASDTQAFKIPFRPKANSAECTGENAGKWWDGTSCYNGLANNISWDLGGHNLTLPSQVIVAVMYNTSDHGYQPLGYGPLCHGTPTGCGYDSLNVALNSDDAAPSVGLTPMPDAAYLSSTYPGFYLDNGLAGVGVFRLDSGPSWNIDATIGPWTGMQPAIQIDAYPQQTGPTGPAGATGPAGPAGTDGSDGATGPAGPIGLTGPAGPAGADGSNGATGPAGPIGLTGPAGPAGTDGSDGATGPAGPIGLTGPVGPAGADGTNAVATPAAAVSRPNTKLVRAKIRPARHIATFSFKGSGGKGKLSFQCRLDAKKYTSCRSGKTYRNLKPGKHVFRVRAKDASGKLDLTPVTKKFVI